MPGRPVIVGPLQDGAAGELGAIISDDASGLSVDPHQRFQLTGDTGALDAGVGGQAQVLPAAIVDHRQNAELARGADEVGQKVERPAGIGMRRLRHRRS